VKNALLSLFYTKSGKLLDPTDSSDLKLKKPSELKKCMKDKTFLKYFHLDIFQDRVESVLQSWSKILPLPEIKRIGNYCIPEIREEEVEVGDNDDEEEKDGLPADGEEEQASDEDMEEETQLGTQLETQLPLGHHDYGSESDLKETDTFATADEGSETQFDTQLEQPQHSPDDAGARSVRELAQKRRRLRDDTRDPLPTVLEIAATAKGGGPTPKARTRKTVRSSNDDIESVESRELGTSAAQASRGSRGDKNEPKQSTAHARKRPTVTADTDDEDAGNRTPKMYRKRKSAKRLEFNDSQEDDLMADTPTSGGKKKRRKKRLWTDEEKASIKAGFQRYGRQWAKIKSDFPTQLQHRTGGDLKVSINVFPKCVLFCLLHCQWLILSRQLQMRIHRTASREWWIREI